MSTLMPEWPMVWHDCPACLSRACWTFWNRTTVTDRQDRRMTPGAHPQVTLSHVEPEVLRRFDVPLKIKLDRLQEVKPAARAEPAST